MLKALCMRTVCSINTEQDAVIVMLEGNSKTVFPQLPYDIGAAYELAQEVRNIAGNLALKDSLFGRFLKNAMSEDGKSVSRKNYTRDEIVVEYIDKTAVSKIKKTHIPAKFIPAQMLTRDYHIKRLGLAKKIIEVDPDAGTVTLIFNEDRLAAIEVES